MIRFLIKIHIINLVFILLFFKRKVPKELRDRFKEVSIDLTETKVKSPVDKYR